MLAPGSVLQNRYEVVRLLSQGGMGAVYEARDQQQSETVALKECFFNDDAMRHQFEREARLLEKLHHHALTRLIDYFTENDGQFLVMEFIPGDDLGGMIADRGYAFPPDEVLTWGEQLLEALEYLHTQEPPTVHRDIKPQNLKLNPAGHIILLDFGLAKGSVSQYAPAARSMLGYTPYYAPLEQIQGTGTDPRSDIYSLAATMYHLMTGATPPDALSRATALITGKPDPLARADEINPHVPVEIATLLTQAMSLNRDQRPASADAMRTALRTLQAALAINEGGAASAPSAATASAGNSLQDAAQAEPEAQADQQGGFLRRTFGFKRRK
jgi:serine/threonine protein kinase